MKETVSEENQLNPIMSTLVGDNISRKKKGRGRKKRKKGDSKL